VLANASPHRRVAQEQLAEIAHASHTVRDYLAELEQQNPVADPPPEPPPPRGPLSSTDPDAAWAVKWGRAGFAYYDNYLIDNAAASSRCGRHPGALSARALAARRMLEHLDHSACARRVWGRQSLRQRRVPWRGSSGRASSLTSRSLIVATRRAKHFNRNSFAMAPDENAYYCPRANRCAIAA